MRREGDFDVNLLGHPNLQVGDLKIVSLPKNSLSNSDDDDDFNIHEPS